ncbi:transposase, partial [Actinoplanes sp. NPDC051851]|uniref:transposase n=1 Tax=Actinoplanes sp. NPDC051851 TaxID=3154753 RepID=UPI00341D734D
ESVHAQFDKLLDTTGRSLPKVAAYLDDARADLLAFTAFPQQIWRQIWSNNLSSPGFDGELVIWFSGVR